MIKWFKELLRYKAAWLKLYYKLKEIEKIDNFHGLYYEGQQVSVKEIIKWMDSFMEVKK